MQKKSRHQPAFSCCAISSAASINLVELRIPQSVERLLTAEEETGKFNPAKCDTYYSCKNRSHEIFPRNPKLTIYCPKDGKTEEFCIEKKFAYKYSEAEEAKENTK